MCSQNCDETNSPKNEKDEKDFKNFSSESSDSYYKNKFRLKKNSIEIKKKSLLKSKLKNDDIQTIIKNDRSYVKEFSVSSLSRKYPLNMESLLINNSPLGVESDAL